jgi:hypothetical protein
MQAVAWSSNLQQAVRSAKRMEVHITKTLLNDSQQVEISLEEKRALEDAFSHAKDGKGPRNSFWA